MPLPAWILIGVFVVVITFFLIMDIINRIVMHKQKKKIQEEENRRKAARKTMAQWYLMSIENKKAQKTEIEQKH